MTRRQHLMALTFIAMGGAVITGATVAGAQAMMEGHHEGMTFESLDTNGDGQITSEEIAALRAERIEGLDANDDGQLSAEEIASHHMRMMETRMQARAAAMVERLDVEGDGLLSVEEVMAQPMGMMHGSAGLMRLDRDGDGAVSQEEFQAARTIMQRQHDMRGHHGKRGGDGRGGHGPSHGGHSGGAMEMPLDAPANESAPTSE